MSVRVRRCDDSLLYSQISSLREGDSEVPLLVFECLLNVVVLLSIGMFVILPRDFSL